jgi:hypothetical protein
MTQLLLDLEDVAAQLVAVRFSRRHRVVELWVREHRAAVFDRDHLRRWLNLPKGDLRQGDVVWTAASQGVVLTIRAVFISTHLTPQALSMLRAHI